MTRTDGIPWTIARKNFGSDGKKKWRRRELKPLESANELRDKRIPMRNDGHPLVVGNSINLCRLSVVAHQDASLAGTETTLNL
jgi:hypothetical protein